MEFPSAEPSCSEVTALTATPPCHFHIQYMYLQSTRTLCRTFTCHVLLMAGGQTWQTNTMHHQACDWSLQTRCGQNDWWMALRRDCQSRFKTACGSQIIRKETDHHVTCVSFCLCSALLNPCLLRSCLNRFKRALTSPRWALWSWPLSWAWEDFCSSIRSCWNRDTRSTSCAEQCE